ncbi:hypothetical protein M8618_004934 [Escherichia coli]|nr:hypothetical protein [Escherichia coli]EJF8953079.1 hypothetical protein [Escherichia coli]
MNARKAVLADNPELILRVLQLRFDESLSYPRISGKRKLTAVCSHQTRIGNLDAHLI